MNNQFAHFGQTNSERAVARTHNSTYKKLAVEWLNEHLYFVSSSVAADSFVLADAAVSTSRNRHLLLAAKRQTV